MAEMGNPNHTIFVSENIDSLCRAVNPPSAEAFLYPFLGGKGSFLTPGDFYGNMYKSIVQYSTQKY